MHVPGALLGRQSDGNRLASVLVLAKQQTVLLDN
jgi:hypothetical protein